MGDDGVSVSPHLPWLDASLVSPDRSPAGLLHQTSSVTVRRASLAGAPTHVAALSFRSSHPKKAELWHATLRLLEHHVLGQPCHPNFVAVVGLATASDRAEPPLGDAHVSCVVMEMMATSLYTALHADRLDLTRQDIVFIALEVLHALDFLHRTGSSFGSTLTSRKVMLGGTRHVKLRRLCSEWIYNEAGIVSTRAVSSSCSSQYAMPGSDPTTSPQRQDLYAFGVLLLEMCTRDKPTPETFNSISLAAHFDPRLETVVRAALGVDAISGKEKTSPPEPSALMAHCLRLLAECADEKTPTVATSTDSHCSSRSLASFLHADRYFAELEDWLVEQRVAERMAQSTVALKRLAAVEEDLVEEQKNFEVIVRQLEQVRLEKARDETSIDQLRADAVRADAGLHARDEAILQRQGTILELEAQIKTLERTLESTNEALRRAHTDRTTIDHERQGLLVEIVRVKEDKAACIQQKHDVERQLAEVAAKVGGERDALDELDARWRQAIHFCEQEQATRRAAERQLEALSRQLTAMEEERSRYTGALQFAPTGPLDARSSKNLVLDLKEKEVHGLRLEIHALTTVLATTRHSLEDATRELCRARDVVCVELEQQLDSHKAECEHLMNRVHAVKADRDSLQRRLEQAAVAEANLRATIDALETQVADLQRQSADAEKARRLRQCLTPNCDAPRYLVKASGFCVDCEEKMSKGRKQSTAAVSSASAPSRAGGGNRGHRRQRSLDGAHAILNSTRNTPIIDLVKRLEVARDCDDESREQSAMDVIAVVKDLGRLLKDTASLKEDLPECGVFRSVLSVMEQFIVSPAVAIECCKTLSVTVFNHDRNRLILVAEGIVEMLLRMMTMFPRETKVVEIGAVMFTNLSHNCESNRQRILAAGGVDAVLEAMQAFPRSANIQKKACWALLTLAGSDFMCDKIASLGGVGATLAAMLNCPDDEDVQHFGSWALLNLVSGARHLQQFARREGVVEVAEAALACFPDHEGIQEKCREILELIHTTLETSS